MKPTAMKTLQITIDDLRIHGNHAAALELIDAKVAFEELFDCARAVLPEVSDFAASVQPANFDDAQEASRKVDALIAALAKVKVRS